MRLSPFLLGVVLALLAPAAATPQSVAPTSAEIRQTADAFRRLTEEFKTDEDELIDGLRKSAERLERPPDCDVDPREAVACTVASQPEE